MTANVLPPCLASCRDPFSSGTRTGRRDTSIQLPRESCTSYSESFTWTNTYHMGHVQHIPSPPPPSPPHTYCFRFSGCEVHCESLQCSSGGSNPGEHSSSGPFLHTGLAQDTALPRKLCAQETLSLNVHNSSSVSHTLGNPALTSRLNIDPRFISCKISVQLMDCLDNYTIKLARSTSCHEAGSLTVCVPPVFPPGSV